MKKKLKYILIILGILIICTILIILDSYMAVTACLVAPESIIVKSHGNLYRPMCLIDDFQDALVEYGVSKKGVYTIKRALSQYA